MCVFDAFRTQDEEHSPLLLYFSFTCFNSFSKNICYCIIISLVKPPLLVAGFVFHRVEVFDCVICISHVSSLWM